MKSIGRAAALFAVLGMPVVAYVLAQVAVSMWEGMDSTSLADAGLALEDGLALLAAAVGSAVAAYLALTGYAMLVGAAWRGGRSIPKALVSLAPHGWARVTATALGLSMTAGLAAPALATSSFDSQAGTQQFSAGWVAAPHSSAANAKPHHVGWASADSSPHSVGWIAPDEPSTPATPEANSLPVTSDPDGARMADTGPESSRQAPPNTSSEYVVQPGDSLWLITQGLLGVNAGAAHVAAAWPELYEANHDAIGDDPSLIQPGLELTIPLGIGA